MSPYYKYPRTPHLPWSRSVASDDAHLCDTTNFENREVVVTEKMDGENTSLYRDHIHARSLDSQHHPSRNWVKQFHGDIAYTIPLGWRLCGENLYARHSIAYSTLASYFYGFSLWNERNICLNWSDTLEWFDLLGIQPVPVLYQGPWRPKVIQSLPLDTATTEGYVVRVGDAFGYEDFSTSVAKWVRPQHVQTDQHWMFTEIVPNQLCESDDK